MSWRSTKLMSEPELVAGISGGLGRYSSITQSRAARSRSCTPATPLRNLALRARALLRRLHLLAISRCALALFATGALALVSSGSVAVSDIRLRCRLRHSDSEAASDSASESGSHSLQARAVNCRPLERLRFHAAYSVLTFSVGCFVDWAALVAHASRQRPFCCWSRERLDVVTDPDYELGRTSRACLPFVLGLMLWCLSMSWLIWGEA